MNKITLWCSALFIIIGSFTATSQTEGTDFPSGPTTDSNFTFNLVAGANTFSGSLDTPTDSQDNWQIVIGTGQTITSITYTIQNNFGISNGFFAFGPNQEAFVTYPPSFSGSISSSPFFTSPGTYAAAVVANIAESASWSVTINVTQAPVAGPPTVTSNIIGVGFSENGPAIALNNQVSISDSSNITQMVITERSGAAGSDENDILTLSNSNGYSISSSADKSQWTITGNGSAAQATAALRSVMYQNTGQNPTIFGTNNGRGYNLSVTNALGLTTNIDSSEYYSLGFALIINDAPTSVINNTLTANNLDSTVITSTHLLGLDPDDRETGLVFTVSNVPSNGNLRLNGTILSINGTFTQSDINNNRLTYENTNGSASTDSFVFNLSDGGEDGAAAISGRTFSITIESGDTTAPRIDSIVRVDPINRETNENRISFDITFNEPVSNISLNDFELIGSSSLISDFSQQATTRYRLAYENGNLSNVNGIVSLGLSSGYSITDLAGNSLVNTTPIGVNEDYLMDNLGPVVTSVTVPVSATYTTGQNLDFIINFNENAIVNTFGGTPQLPIVIGTITKQAAYVSGSGTNGLLFRYTVLDGDLDTDGVEVGTLMINGGSIADTLGNNANLTLSNIGNTNGVLVGNPCTNPDTPAISASSENVCPGESVVLTITGNLNDAAQWAIYSGSCGGTLVGTTTTTTFEVTPNSNTQYLVRGEGGCAISAGCGSVTVMAEDTEAPTVICPEDIVVSNDPGNYGAIVTYPSAITADNCSSELFVSYSQESGTFFPVGSTQVTVTVNEGNSPEATNTQILTLGNGNDGEAIAFNPTNGVLFHASGISDGNQYFEPINLSTLTVGANIAPGNTYPAGIEQEVVGMVYYPPLNGFVAMDRDENIALINTDNGTFSLLSTLDRDYIRGYAVNGNSVFGVDPFSSALVEFDPTTGVTLSTVPVVIDGVEITSGSNGLSTSPITGITYIVYKLSGGLRGLASIDLSTGIGESIGSTGTKIAGISFSADGTLYGVSGDGANPAETLYRFDSISSNSATCTFNVIVNDTEAPTITCPDDIIVNSDPGSCEAIVNYNFPTTTDNCSVNSTSDSITFSFTGAPESFIVPAGVTEIFIQSWGAQGQAITVDDYQNSVGGLGGYSEGILSVTPGETLEIYVGGTGTNGVGGFNGGGTGGAALAGGGGSNGFGGSGGGSSDVRQGGSDLINRVIVAGGGGGGGRSYVNGSCVPCGVGGDGGDGGGITGVNGEDPADPNYSSYFNPGSGGSGATATAGGSGGMGTQGTNGNPGAFGLGGNGLPANYGVASGGGGGGYYGGGSGAIPTNGSGAAAGGGAGGSSYLGTLTNSVTTTGIRSGNGEIILSYEGCVEISQTEGLPSGSAFPVGITTNTFIATDASGNTSTCSFTITVEDSEGPISDVLILDDVIGECQVNSIGAPTATDACEGQVVGITDAIFPITENTTITWTYQDSSGNMLTQTQNVFITDTTPPVANMMTLEDINEQCQVDSLVAPTATDNCSGQINGTSNTAFPISESTTITWTYEDEAGNISTQTQEIIIEDTEAPTVACPENIVVSNDPGLCGAVVNFDIPEFSDNCVIDNDVQVTLNFTGSSTFGSPYTESGMVITAFASEHIDAPWPVGCGDGQGMLIHSNTGNTWEYNGGETFTPSSFIACQTGMRFTALPSMATFIPEETGLNVFPSNEDWRNITGLIWENTSTSDVSLDNFILNESGIQQTAGLPSGSEFPIGTTTITYEVTDNSGNQTTCSFDVTVNDIEAPVVECQDVTVELDNNGVATITQDDVIANLISSSVTYSIDQSGTFAPIDISANSTQVVLSDDSVSGAIPLGFDFSFFNNDYSEYYISSNGFLKFGSGLDDGCCGGQLLPNTSTPNNLIAFAWDDLFPQGSGSITYATTGVAPNRIAVLQFTDIPFCCNSTPQVTTQVKLFESTNVIEIHSTSVTGSPMTQGIENIDGTIGLTVAGRNSANWNTQNDFVAFVPEGDQNVADNCGLVYDIALSQDTFTCDDIGENTVTITVTDEAGNVGTCDAVVTIEDNSVPVATAMDITVQLDENGTVTITGDDINNGSTDNCIESITVTPNSFNCSNTETPVEVTMTVTDIGGNIATDTAMVTIEDTILPIANAMNATVQLDENGVATITVQDINDGSSDICGIETLSVSPSTFDCSNLNTPVEVTLMVTDNNGNSSTDTAMVTVQDNLAPAADLLVLEDVMAQCQVDNISAPTATDNCVGSVIGTTVTIFPITEQGTTIVTWTYEDESGNTSTQTQNVIIEDITPPTPDVMTLSDVEAECQVDTLVAPTATDNCVGDVTVTNDANLPMSTQGTTVITWTYEDENGNTSTQTQNVVIEDATSPTPDVIALSDIEAECQVDALVAPTATDNCSGDVIVSNDADLPITTQGTTVITWTYEDVNGNSSSQTQNVVIEDVTSPIPDLMTLSDVEAECQVDALVAPTATDNCSGDVIVSNDADLPITAQGTTVITWTYEDVNGNISTQTQNVVIEDVSGPVADAGTLEDITAECILESITIPSATDNCTGPVQGTTDTVFPIEVQGTTEITWTYEDDNGNITTQTQNVIIEDVTAPVPIVTVLPDISEDCAVLSLPIPKALDNCSGSVSGVTTTVLPLTTPGTTVVVWSYTDDVGNVSTQTQNVTVNNSPLDQVVFNDETFIYDGDIQDIEVLNLPNGASVVYSTTPSTGIPNGAINAGIYTVSAVITPPSTSPNCDEITLTATLTIDRSTQEIVFNPIPVKEIGVDPDFQLMAEASSGLPITYTYTYTGTNQPADVSAEGFVTLLATGQVTITANQEGDSNYLPATPVSQELIIESSNANINTITIEGQVYNDPDNLVNYIIDCGFTVNSVQVVIDAEPSAIVTPATVFEIETPVPGIYLQDVVVTSQNGSMVRTYTIRVEKQFLFNDIAEQKFDNVLLVNNNPNTNGGYSFVAYEWYKDNVLVGTEQYYSAGATTSDLLDPNATYFVKMTTVSGDVLQTCAINIELQHSYSISVTPNPTTQLNRTLNVSADIPATELDNMIYTVFNMSGKVLKQGRYDAISHTVRLPETIQSGIYMINFSSPNVNKVIKLIVE